MNRINKAIDKAHAAVALLKHVCPSHPAWSDFSELAVEDDPVLILAVSLDVTARIAADMAEAANDRE